MYNTLCDIVFCVVFEHFICVFGNIRSDEIILEKERYFKMKTGRLFSSLIFCLMTVFLSVLCLNVSALDDIPTYTVTTEQNDSGEVLVSVTFTPDCAAAGDIVIQYNKEKLELESMDKGSVPTATVITNPHYSDNSVKVDFFSVYEVVGGYPELCTMKFRLTKGSFEKSDISVVDYDLYDINAKLLSDIKTTEPVYVQGCTHQNIESSVTKEPTESESGEQTVTCPDCSKTYTEKIPSLKESPAVTSKSVSENPDNNSSDTVESSGDIPKNSEISNEEQPTVSASSDESSVSSGSAAVLTSDNNNSKNTEITKYNSTTDNSVNANNFMIIIVIAVVFVIALCVVALVLWHNKKSDKKNKE